jgi:hypothetical protein
MKPCVTLTGKIILVLGVLAGLFLACVPAFPQANQGRILGAVSDQSGGAMAGALVTVTDSERGVSRTLTADDAGEYNAPNLLPGTYTVRAEARGFKTSEHTGILLEVGKELRVDLTLQPGEQTEKITVTAEIPMVETTNATLGGTLSNQTINDLPVIGRDYINLITLRPGVTVNVGGGTYNRVSNGMRPEDNVYMIDGLRGDEAYTGQSVLNAPIAAGDTSTVLPIDAIQEFNTEENPKAEFGWKPGATVNAGLKSGTNTLHGTALAFGRDTALDARNFFDQAPQPKAAVGLEQFGASLGGPLKKDKIFWFVNYEGQRYNVASVLPLTTPATVGLTPFNPGSSFVDACTDLNNKKLPISALSAQLIGLNTTTCTVAPTNFTPGPTESLFPTNTGTAPIILGLVSTNQQDNGVGKIDYHINDRHSLSGMYFIGHGGGIWNDSPSELGVAGSSNSPWMSALGPVTAHLAAAGWTWTPKSTLVNELRIGYDHFYNPYLSVDHNVNPTAYGINTGVTNPDFFGFPAISITGFSGSTGAGWPKITGPDASVQLLDHVSVLRGKHAFKFGGEFIYNSATTLITSNGKGAIPFTTVENFLTGAVKSSGAKILVGDARRHMHDEQYAVFAQDDWRITPRITANIGLRYELNTVLQENNNLIGSFDPTSTTGLVQVGNGLTSAFNGDHNNLSPRLGLVWDVRGNGKTVVRAGGSIIYEQLPMVAFVAIANSLGAVLVPTGAKLQVNGVTTAGTGTIAVAQVNVPGGSMNWAGSSVGGAPIFPVSTLAVTCGDGQTPAGKPADANPCTIMDVARNLRSPYADTWTLNIQRAIANNLSLEIGYVGTHGTKLLGFQDINQPTLGAGFTPALLAACNNGTQAVCDPGAASATLEQTARPYYSRFPYLGSIDLESNLDESNYNALQTVLSARNLHGLTFTAGYTYAHALDDASGNFSNTIPLDSTNPGLQYASSAFDIRHRFTFTTNYNLPGRKSPGQMLEGWQLNSVVSLQKGQPWSPSDTSNDFSGTGQEATLATSGQRWDFLNAQGGTGTPADFAPVPNVTIPCWSGSGASALKGCSLAAKPPACAAAATAMGAGTLAALNAVGCYAQGSSVLIPPALGSYGTAGRNILFNSGYADWDLSATKNWRFKERLTAQFRAEFFNVLNHPTFNSPSASPTGGLFGGGFSTPDQAGANPVLGTGGSRSIQLGLKLSF